MSGCCLTEPLRESVRSDPLNRRKVTGRVFVSIQNSDHLFMAMALLAALAIKRVAGDFALADDEHGLHVFHVNQIAAREITKGREH